MQKTPQTRVLLPRTLSTIMLRVFVAFLGVVILTSVINLNRPQPAEAAAAKTLNFQARLLGQNGAIVPDGNYHVEFKLYKSASANASAQGTCVGGVTDDCLWMETRTTGNLVSVKAGYLSVYLGDVTDLPADIWNQQLWLTMNIGGMAGSASWDGEMSPRLRLTAVPAAYSLTNYNSATGFSSTLSIAGATGGDQNFTIPDQGQAGNFTLLTTQSANTGFIQNQNSVDQTANFRISGTGQANTSFLSPLFDALAGGTLGIGTANATAITIGDAGVTTTNAGAMTVTELTTLNGGLTVSNTGNVAFQKAASDVSTTGNVNDVAITGALVRFTGASQQTLTGVAGGVDGRMLTIFNAANSNLIINNNDTVNSSAGNTIITGTGSAVSIPSGGSLTLMYDSTSAVWRVIGVAASAGVGGSYVQNTTVVQDQTNFYIRSNGNTVTGVLEGSNGQTADILRINTFDGSVSTTVARFDAGGNLIFTGNTTANRPSSPSEGMLFFDTDTKQLLVYANGKWQGDRSTATKIVAASNSSQAVKDGADYVADGTGDQTEINAALTAAAGGKVYLAEGTYTINASISIPNNTTLAGAGRGTLITIPNGHNTSIDAITNTDTTTGTGVVIQDLRLDGNKANQSGSVDMRGIYMNGVGGGSGSGARQGAIITNTWVNNWFRNTASPMGAIHLNASSNSTLTGNTALANAGDGIYATGSSNNLTITGNLVQGNTVFGMRINSSSYVTVTGNTAQGNSQGGIFIVNGGNNTINGNTVAGNAVYGILVNTSNNNTFASNNIYDSGSSTANNGILLDAADYNTIANNTITDTSCTTTCYAINIFNNTSDKNYLSGNRFTGSAANAASINDAGTGTIYEGQQTNSTTSTDSNVSDFLFRGSANSTTAFRIQNATGANTILNIDTTGTGTLSIANDITVTPAAGSNLFNILTGNLKVGDGSPSVAMDGEDAYIEGTLEVDGSARFDTNVLTPTVDTATGVALNIGTTTATGVNIGRTGQANTIVGSNFNLSSAGVVTLAGGQTADITTNGATALTIDTGGAAAVNIGTANANAISIGRNGITTTNSGALTVTQATTLNGGLTVSNAGNVAFQRANDISTTGALHDEPITGALVRFTGASTQTLTGIAGGTNGRILTIFNAGSQALIINNEDNGSVVGNQIVTGTGASISVPVGSSVILIYDSADGVWRVASGTVAATGGYIQNQNSGDQTGNFRITGTGQANTSFLTPTLDTATGVALNIGTTTATGVNIGRTGQANTIVGSNFNLSSAGVVTLAGGQTADITTNGATALTIDTGGAAAINLGTTNATAINLNQSTTVAAGKTIRLVGGNTASRPGAPTAGMLYYDTDTNELLTYNGTKWVASRGEYKIVAASDSTQAEKDAADYVADGTGDQAEINSALIAAAGGKVLLLAGTYTINASILIPDNTTLAGVGQGTLITIPNGLNSAIDAIAQDDNLAADGITIQDLQLDGNKGGQSSGTMNGILIYGDGSGSLTLTNTVVADWRTDGVAIASMTRGTITSNTIIDNGGYGISLSGGYSLVTNNRVNTNASGGIFLNAASNSTVSSNTLFDNGGSTTNNAIVLTSATNNNIVANSIADSSASSNNYAINITNGGSTSNYLSDNTFSTGTINDAGTGTIYGGQSTGTAFAIQPSMSVAIAPNNAGTLTLGGAAQTGTITIGQSTATNIINVGSAIGNGATQTINIGTSATAGSTTNVTIGSTIAGATTLQSAGGVYLTTLGNADTDSYAVCRDASTSQLTACDANNATGQAFLNGLNTFSGTATLGTNSTGAGALQLQTSGVARMIFAAGTNNVYFGNADANGVAASPNSFTINGTGSSTAGTAGGALSVIGGAGATTTTGSNGGAVTIQGGTASGTNARTGGAVNITGGTPSATGTGGAINITTGAGGATSGNSGALDLRTGSVTSGGNTSGAIVLQSGNTTNGTAGNVSIDVGTGTAASAINIGTSTNSATKTITIGSSNGTGNITLGSSSAGQSVLIANGTGAATVSIATNNTSAGAISIGNNNNGTTLSLQGGNGASAVSVQAASGGTISVGTNAASTINIGTGAFAHTIAIGTDNTTTQGITIGSSSASSTTTIQGGTSASAVSIQAGSAGTISIGTTTASTVNIATGAFAHTVAIGTDGTTTQAITIGSTSASSTTSITGGTGASALSLQAGTSGTISLGTTNANIVNIGSTNASTTVSLQGGGGINIGTGNAANTIQIGTANQGIAQTINIGNNSSAGGTTNIVIGAGTSGNTGQLGTTTVTSVGGTTISTANRGATTNSASAVTIQGGNGGTATTGGAGGGVTIQGGNAGGTGANAGGSISITAGNSSATGTGAAGNITLQGGAALGGNTNGGSITISGGAGNGAGTQGLVNLSTTAFTTSTAEVIGTSTSIDLTKINNYSTVPVRATAVGLVISVPDPSQAITGRLIYIAATDTSEDFTLRLNAARTPIDIAIKKNNTATLIWNGTDWTAAGASSSTDLQSAYNNTLTSAGGAEIVLNPIGGNADGFTIRNNGTSPIMGGLLEVQTSIGSNLVSINNNAVEYASNGGAETAGGSSTTFPSNTWSASPTGGTTATVSRTVTSSEFATGIAATKVVTTSSPAAQGAANQIVFNGTNTALSTNLQYSVAFTVKSVSNFNTLEVVYSRDGTNTSTTTCAANQIATQSVWSRIDCTFTAPSSGITSSNKLFIRNSASSAQTFYIDNLSITVNASANHAADGSVETGSLGSNWTSYGTGASANYETANIYDGQASARATTTGSASSGIRNNLAITPSTGTQYLISFYAKVSTGSFSTFAVAYSPTGGSSPTACTDYNTTSISSTTWTKVTCIMTTPGTTVTNPDLLIYQTDTGSRTFYIDQLVVSLNTNTASNLQVGGGRNGGPTTLFTLDRASSPPISANNDAYLGSMYYDTVTGRIQCYESDGWGACGAAPDVYVNIQPEYAGAVFHGTGVGTMTADFCSDSLDINDPTNGPTICDTNETYNFYAWTSPQATPQSYSIYVTYQLPAAFKGFASDDTVKLTGRVSNTSNASVVYQMYRDTGAGLTQCGTGSTDVITTPTGSAGSANTWYTYGINGNESTGCSFSSASANRSVVFKITMTSQSNAYAYVSNLSFITTGQ